VADPPQPMRCPVVLFDLGGTLIDEHEFSAWTEEARRVGLDFPEDHLAHAYADIKRETDGPGDLTPVSWWQKVLSRAAGRDVTEVTAERFRGFLLARPVQPRLYSDARRCLVQLREDGRRMGIISNSPSEARVREILTATGIAEYFDVVISSGTEGIAKPDPTIFRRGAERMHVAPDEACYVGDWAYRDAKAAIAAGLRGVWLNRDGWGFGGDPPEITSLTELPFHLLALEGRLAERSA
jgi:HAD superfamily hydrolase (TIGR01509 family)